MKITMKMYILFGDDVVPKPIKVTEIDKLEGEITYECDYSYGNKDDWDPKFLGTPMQGLTYDPHEGWFNVEDVKKIDGNKIYLKK